MSPCEGVFEGVARGASVFGRGRKGDDGCGARDVEVTEDPVGGRERAALEGGILEVSEV
jgi:hypothetical protein